MADEQEDVSAEISLDHIQSAFDADQKLFDAYLDEITSKTNGYRSTIIDFISDESLKLIQDKDGNIKPTKQNLNRLEIIERQLRNLLMGSPYEDMTQDIVKTINKRIDSVDLLMKELDIKDGVLGKKSGRLPQIIDKLDVLIGSVNSKQTEAVNAMRKAFLNYYFDVDSGTKTSYQKLYDDLIKKGKVLPQYAKMAAHTTIGAVDQDLKREQSEEAGLRHGKYMGPLDGLTRPFCAQTVGTIKTWDEWDQTYNNVGPQPVSTYRGGYGPCRHRIQPWDLEWDEL